MKPITPGMAPDGVVKIWIEDNGIHYESCFIQIDK